MSPSFPRALRPSAWFWAVPLIASAHASGAARAEAPEEVAILMEPCDQASAAGADELWRALQAEFAPVALRQLEPHGEAPPRAQARLEVSWCHGLSHVTLRMPEESGEQQRSLALADAPPEVRARTIALSVGELWRAAQPEERLLRRADAPAKTKPRTQAPRRRRRQNYRREVPPQPEAQEPKRPLEVSARAGMRTALAVDTMLFGGTLAIAARHVEVGALLLFTRSDSAPVDLAMGIAAGKLGLELVRLGKRPYLVLRALGEAGTTWATGPRTLGGPHAREFAFLAGGHFEVALVAAMSERWRGELAATFGYERGLTARSYNEARLTTHGAVIGLSLGFSLLTSTDD